MTIITSEIDRFDRLSATWWNSAGPMRPLHVINELRREYFGSRRRDPHGLEGFLAMPRPVRRAHSQQSSFNQEIQHV
jgi:hypothetical protein